MARLYLEHDGRLFIPDKERPDLPEEIDVEIPFETYATRRVRGEEVLFAQAELEEHPTDWPRKDDLAHDPDASPLVHGAINASLFRPIVGVVVKEGGQILLVKPARGVAKGHWTLPGGFVNAFEDPDAAARREVLEETGLAVRDLELVGTLTYRHAGAPYPILGLGYTANAPNREISLRTEEIEQARWIRPEEAIQDAGGLAAAVLTQIAEKNHELA